ncbi:MAG: hypothetical protein KF830_06500 [Planctomycetes bacterium]|nr:hypothetical protein [Planctomycetota bacterium]
MSSKHRRGLPKKRPELSAKSDIADDLPELEPLDEELPTLEPLEAEAEADEGPVRVQVDRTEPDFDVALTVAVPAMDKAAVTEAVARPLERAARAAGLRHQRVLVRFAGEAIVGSAAKARVADVLQTHRPLRVVVRRGYGDEVVFEGRLPAVDATVHPEGGTVKVAVATGATEAVDLPLALAPHLHRIAAGARGRRFDFAFDGGPPGAEVERQITAALRPAGALRAAIGGRVLFDDELAARVRVVAGADGATIEIDPVDDGAAMLAAIGLVLPQHGAELAGKAVGLRGTRPLVAALVDACIDGCRRAGAQNVALLGEGGAEIVWPPLLERETGSETTLRVRLGGRRREAVLAAFRREAKAHGAATKDKDVVVDWPSGFEVDAAIESFCREELGPLLQPRTLACTVGGGQREPMLPEPASLAIAGDEITLRLDTEAGKPVELQRAVDRRVASLAGRLRGKSVRIEIQGQAPLSRTLLRSLTAAIEAAGAMRLVVDDHGAADVLLPPLLTVTRRGDEVLLAAVAAGRDAAQLAKALQRELDAAAIPTTATVVVAAGTAAEDVARAVVARGAATVRLDGPSPVQVHPPLFGPVEKVGLGRRLPARPPADAAMAERQVERELPALLAGLGPVATATITIDWPGADPSGPALQRLLQGLVAKKPAKVLLDRGATGSLQLHPPLEAPRPAPPPPPAPPAAVETAVPAAEAPPSAPGSEAAAAAGVPPVAPAGPCLTLLGQRDAATPPLVMLGVEAGTDAPHLDRVAAELAAWTPRLAGRTVLVVLRRGDRDVPVRREDALVALLRRQLASCAAATLVFRGPDAQQRPHFQVAHSTVDGLAVGLAVADPRLRTG